MLSTYLPCCIFCYRIVNNEEWYRKIDSIQFVSEIGRNFRMGTMLLKHSVQSRINSEVGMSFTEFSYQIFQSYDWLHLLKEYDCRFQVIMMYLLLLVNYGHLTSSEHYNDVFDLQNNIYFFKLS